MTTGEWLARFLERPEHAQELRDWLHELARCERRDAFIEAAEYVEKFGQFPEYDPDILGEQLRAWAAEP